MDWQNISQQLAGLSTDANILASLPVWVLVLVIVTSIWKFTWYGIALYSSSKKQQKTWFIVLFVLMFILNDLGLLPILYLIFNRRKKVEDKKLVKKKK
ncbi:MAG: DUF5652 family protein [archaeon]|nr:DUF5652 family protein [archaeon]